MKDQGATPDEVTYNLLINLLVKHDRLNEALSLFNSQFSIHNYMRENAKSLDIHSLSQGAAFIALCIFIKSYWKDDSFILITGKGLHSQNKNLYEMKNFIAKKIREKFSHLSCEVDEKNEGVLKLAKAEKTTS